VAVHKLSRRDARRVAIQAQWLHRDRPTNLLELVRQLTLLQVDTNKTVAPSADLVAWSRLGSSYSSDDLAAALRNKQLVEFRGTIRPAEDLALYRADMAAWPGAEEQLLGWQKAQRDWLEANDACRRDILKRLEVDGPCTSRELPDTCAVAWRSTGWNNNRNVRQMLELMEQRGEVAVAGRRKRDRLWDLAGRIYPEGPSVPVEEAEHLRNERRLSALGIARAKGPDCPAEPLDVGNAGDSAVVEGVGGTWRVDPALLDEPFDGRAAVLSPLDRSLHDRRRMVDLFEYEYALEMYKPVTQRRWGYYALPILYGDRLVGKLDATTDHQAGVLRVNALHWDVEPSKTMTAAVVHEIRDLASWLGVTPTGLPRT
jgi:uncharacterized protein YcaQ